jgi:hypothetical protein
MARLREPSRTVSVDAAEPILAFRGWRAVEGRLRSPYVPVYWDERVAEAHCNRPALWEPGGGIGVLTAHCAPAPGCSCGIYAFERPSHDLATVDYRGVTGAVSLWGDIQVHADGMRAQHACIEALAIYSRWTARQKSAVFRIADELDVELVDLYDLDAYAERFTERQHATPELLLA